MSYEITFKDLPMGYCAENRPKGISSAKVQMTGFTSSEDGQHFIDRLEGIPADIVNMLPGVAPNLPATLHHLLAIIRRDHTATVYVNELAMHGLVQAKNTVMNAGDVVRKDDIADIHKLSFGNRISIPDDAGVVFVFSIGWRKGLFFDFSPLHPSGDFQRDFDLEVTLGQCFTHLMYQELFRITDHEWERFFDQQWFPFRAVGIDLTKKMISHIRAGWPVDDLLDEITSELKSHINDMMDRWKTEPILSDHVKLLTHAVERYGNGDYVSCTAIVFPRIEGILRSYHTALGKSSKPTQGALAASAVDNSNQKRHARSLLFPERFEQYLKEVYFAGFDPSDPHIKVSRNSVGHGVANAGDFSAKAATIGLLTVQQLVYYSNALVGVPHNQ